jgi:hypothetical protein
MLVVLTAISMLALVLLLLRLQKLKWLVDLFFERSNCRVDDFSDVFWEAELDDTVPETLAEALPEPLKTPDPVRRFPNAGSFLNYDKIGRVIDCRMVQNNGTDFMHLAVLVDDLTDGCQPMICLVTNCFDAPLAQIGDRVRVAFRTDFKLDPVFRRTEVNAFFICWHDRIRRTGSNPTAAIQT